MARSQKTSRDIASEAEMKYEWPHGAEENVKNESAPA